MALFSPKERPLEDLCPKCGEKALVAIQAIGWGPWGGAVICKVCSEKTSFMHFIGHKIVTVEPMKTPE